MRDVQEEAAKRDWRRGRGWAGGWVGAEVRAACAYALPDLMSPDPTPPTRPPTRVAYTSSPTTDRTPHSTLPQHTSGTPPPHQSDRYIPPPPPTPLPGFHIDPYHGDMSANVMADFFERCAREPVYWDKISKQAMERIFSRRGGAVRWGWGGGNGVTWSEEWNVCERCPAGASSSSRPGSASSWGVRVGVGGWGWWGAGGGGDGWLGHDFAPG